MTVLPFIPGAAAWHRMLLPSAVHSPVPKFSSHNQCKKLLYPELTTVPS